LLEKDKEKEMPLETEKEKEEVLKSETWPLEALWS